jgi:hypothetical protein
MADKFEGLRVYVIVPGTVQDPIKITYTPGLMQQTAGRFENTRDIVQPAGRQAMQVGHVRGMVEHHLILSDIAKLHGRKINATTVPYHAITGIVKTCRDSFELIHIKNLLGRANIRYFEFYDTQEDEYEDVVTALATEPVIPFAVAGILDYLPLWGASN